MITRRGGLFIALGIFFLGLSLSFIAIHNFYVILIQITSQMGGGNQINQMILGTFKGLPYIQYFAFYTLTLGGLLLIAASFSLLSFTTSSAIADIEIQRTVDRDRVFMGDYLTVNVKIKNKSNSAIANLLVSDVIPDSFNMVLGDNYAHVYLPPKGTKEFTYIVECPYRGVYVLGPTFVTVRDRAGFFKEEKSFENLTEIIVYPSYDDVKKLEILQRAYGGLIYGPHRVKQRGSGYDFWGIRRYVIGDHVKFIDWKSSARTGRLMVREYEAEKNLKLYILLDASKSMGFGTERMTKLDFATRAAVLLAYLANRFQDSFGLVVYSDEVLSFLEAKKGKKHFLRMLEDLARASPKGASDLAKAMQYLIRRERRASVAIIITDLEGNPTYYEEGIRIALAHKVYPIIISPVSIYFEQPSPDEEPVDKAYREVIYSEYFINREKVKNRLRRYGVGVIDVDPNVFIAVSLETYLRSKGRNIGIM